MRRYPQALRAFIALLLALSVGDVVLSALGFSSRWSSSLDAGAASDRTDQSLSFLRADFNRDGTPDSVALLPGIDEERLLVSIAGFGVRELVVPVSSASAGILDTPDLNQDGDVDLVWVDPKFPLTKVVWLGDGRGNFMLADPSVAWQVDWLHSTPVLPISFPLRTPLSTGRRLATDAKIPRRRKRSRARFVTRVPSGSASFAIVSQSIPNTGLKSWIARVVNLPPPFGPIWNRICVA